ncbi:ubiquinone/menaquinone biosynthesis methyltransferase ubiE [Vibrio ishigakensis]|uniref:Ubiquinone/menaquinone biosynthesis methyltransferase ubiE n=1 Tax=Vibrio ishigakensis TaxID=1481914 RepID=A0A0B8PI27_9VIBR|nr:ubiquinone/menaquinone biosynthesis methyltransferase ubiE [Vibrio ishigakensis]
MKSDMYSKFAREYDQAVTDNLYNAHFERPITLSLLDDVSGLKLLDLGCGPGAHTKAILESGAQGATCIDFSNEMVELVKEKFGEKVEAYQQDLSIGLPKESDESYDLAICPLVIHYIQDLKPLFRDVARVLKPGGKFVFSTHHPFADFEFSQSKNYFDTELVIDEWNTVGRPVEVRFYRRPLQEIMDALTASGLAVMQMSEGQIQEEQKELFGDRYDYLSKNTNFIFMKCVKL